jgi:hypothetical protein
MTLVIMSVNLTTLSIMTLVILSVYLTTLSIIRINIKIKKICSCTGCQNLAHFAECHYIKTLCIRELIRMTLVIMSVNLTTLSIMTLVILSVYLTTLSIIRISIKANKICSCTGCHIVQNVIILNVVVLHVVDPLLMHLNARLVSSLGSIKKSAAVEKCFVFYHGINLLFLTIKM